MTYQWKPVEPTFIPNTTMQKRVEIDDNGNETGVIKSFRIAPVDGYVLHDNTYDTIVVDPVTGEETDEVILGYRTSTASCGANYDFTANPREFYAVPADSVPADQIFGGVTPDHEIM